MVDNENGRCMSEETELCLELRHLRKSQYKASWRHHYQVQVKNIPGKGRGIFLEEAVEEGTFLLEYKSKEVYPREQRKEKEEEYAHYLVGVKIVTGTYLSWRTHIKHLHRECVGPNWL